MGQGQAAGQPHSLTASECLHGSRNRAPPPLQTMINRYNRNKIEKKTRKDWRLHTTLLNLSPDTCTLNSSEITPSKSISHSFIMSAAPNAGTAPATKATSSEKSADSSKDVKPAAALEEDDEFEDFPVDSMLCLIPSDPLVGHGVLGKGMLTAI